ncbi:hypothetical protein LSH36_455g01017 [Paralvinella palmiformis]|uniref:Serine/threonine-protein phosphatase 4 regulatory subunit 3-like central domain-containing protein n=1 Tax=Paralvinella palmiformis TaxID=53620 RepID=A0AAD9MYW7_9ANNE|nr:hypothetical protein LSH36_455g01017 [Paralvinella palmiformis]
MADTNVRRRVKLYMLSEARNWDDQGTGHVSSAYVEKFKGMSLLVRSEEDGSILLESKIQALTAYQKQQDTLIVWSEADNYDYALSFQEKAGCDEIWEKICQVQGKDPSVDITQDILDPEGEDMEEERLEELAMNFDIPPCELSRLEEISELFSSCLLTPTKRERLAILLESENYIKKLLELFHMCEDLENIEGLHHLYEIFKNIILLNKNSLFEIMFADDVIMDVIGVLEYDPAQPKPNRHRDYLRTEARFKEVIPIQNEDLLQKIHQTYRVQFIQDVILPTPSVFEENMLSTLTSFVFFNKVEIVSMIQEDEKFLPSLFEVLTSDETDDEKRKDCILFLKEFCTFSQTLQAHNRDAFFKILSHMGILGAIEIILGLEDEQMKSTAIDIFSYIVEYSPSMVREHILLESQRQDDDELLINLVIDQMITDSDPELGGAVQLMGIIRLLIDPENMLGTTNKTEKTEFLTFFYKHSMHVLTAPLFANTVEDKPSKDDYQTCQLLALILELLTFCIEHHTFHIRNYVTKKDLLRRVLVLLKSKHAFLSLSALRLLRHMVGLKDEIYNRYIINGDLFKPVVDAFIANGNRYNLLNSALIELFEYIRLEDIKSLNTYIVEMHIKSFEHVDYVDTFKGLVIRYDHQKHLAASDLPDKPLDSMQSLVSSRFRKDARALEDEEEIWFNEDDEFDGENIVPVTDMLKNKLDSGFEQINRLIIDKAKTTVRDGDFRQSPPRLINKGSISFNISRSPTSNSPSPTPASSPNSTPNNSPVSKSPDSKVPLPASKTGLVGLVDYPDEDSEEEEEEEEDGEFHVNKRPRLST